MYIRFKELSELKIQAQDGEIGSVDDVLFDENNWIVRYVVADTGGWLFGRKVLIAPIAIEELHSVLAGLPVAMTKQQVKDSPDILTDLPLSHDQEVEYHDFFRWPYYWGGGGIMAGTAIGVDPLAYVAGDTEVTPDPHTLPPDQRDYSLRSAKALTGYKLAQSKAEATGEVDDFVIDTSNWTVTHLAVKAEDGGDVITLLPVGLVRQVGYEDEVFHLYVDPSSLLMEPPYSSEITIERRYLDEVEAYYRHVPAAGRPAA
jgi:sporulation protein YlmC with PRC-barrel domain